MGNKGRMLRYDGHWRPHWPYRAAAVKPGGLPVYIGDFSEARARARQQWRFRAGKAQHEQRQGTQQHFRIVTDLAPGQGQAIKKFGHSRYTHFFSHTHLPDTPDRPALLASPMRHQ